MSKDLAQSFSVRVFNDTPRSRLVERRRDERARTVRVLLTRKLADYLDGIDLSMYREGDMLDVPRREAELLIKEGWAIVQPKAGI